MKIAINKSLPFNYGTNCLELKVTGNNLNQIHKLEEAVLAGKQLDVEIKIHRKKRSLQANACLWAMINDIAAVLKKPTMEVYIDMLKFYGYNHIIPVFPEDLERTKLKYRYTEIEGKKSINGFIIIFLHVWEGTSDDVYNTKEFARLLDGVIYEAKELGVEYLSKADRDLVLSTYEEDKLRS